LLAHGVVIFDVGPERSCLDSVEDDRSTTSAPFIAFAQVLLAFVLPAGKVVTPGP
jgi:hypothetical protein